MKRSILYLDDEAVCLNIFAATFGEDYDVRTARTLAEARRLLAQRPADIVISDQLMPEIEGTKFLREVARKYPASYRMMLTGSAMVGDMIHEVSTGTVHLFVAKPWTKVDRRQRLERASMSFDLHAK